MGTLVAQDHGHHPAVAQSAGFCTEHSAKARSIGYEEETAPTLRAGTVPAALSVQNNPTDSRVKIDEEGLVQALTHRMGTGGNSVPLVADPEPMTLKIRCGHGNGGRGALVQKDKSATLATNNDQTLFQPECRAFGVCSKSSYAMLSDNPNSGFYEADTSRTLDRGGGAPCSNQGGLCVLSPAEKETYDVCFTSEGSKVTRGHVYPADTARTLSADHPDPAGNQGGVAILEKDPAFALQGSMIGRQEKNGPQGSGANENVSFTLDTNDRHAVAQPTYSATVGGFMHSSEETAQTLMARDYKDPQIVNAPSDGPVYIVRRLTPVEAARLQGFPDWWAHGLETPEPTEEDIAFWTDVFETHRRLTNPGGKPKTRSQIIRWLKNPYSESAEFSMWGNGITLNVAYFVLAGIVWADSLPG